MVLSTNQSSIIGQCLIRLLEFLFDAIME